MSITLYPAQRVSFGSDQDTSEALVEGWSTPEQGQVWSDGPSATLRFKIDQVPPGSSLLISASPHLVGDIEEQRVVVYGNGLYITSVFLGRVGDFLVRLPPYIAVSVMMSGALDLSFAMPECRRPVGTSDVRKLGIALHAVELRNR